MTSRPDVHLPCPKCTTPMRTIERSGILLETCPDCRGVFLDRGELDRLLDLEAATSADQLRRSAGGRAAEAGMPGPGDRAYEFRRDRDHDDDDDDDDDGPRGRLRLPDDGRRPSRRGGLLSDLFENFGG